MKYWTFQKLAPETPAQLLEYDKRFGQYGTEFTFYDYNQPEELPSSLKHSFSIVVADPPYLVNFAFSHINYDLIAQGSSFSEYVKTLRSIIQETVCLSNYWGGSCEQMFFNLIDLSTCISFFAWIRGKVHVK